VLWQAGATVHRLIVGQNFLTMKKALLFLLLVATILAISIFIYNRYKTKRIDEIIGANQYRIEEYLNFPAAVVELDSVTIDNVESRIQKILNSKNIKTNKKLLRYTLKGSIRKEVYWLVDQGSGYYVIEAINTNL
jgi:hypothetical protein